MTEKEKTLAMVIKYFMETGKKDSQSKNEMIMVKAGQWHNSAIEVAGLGAAVSTIDWAVREYLRYAKDGLFGHDSFGRAICMTLQGASKEVAEEVVAVAVKYYSWIWPLEKLTGYLGRDPKEEEIFGIVKVERENMTSLGESYHDELIKFAKKYLKEDKVQKIKRILEEKTREFNSHSD